MDEQVQDLTRRGDSFWDFVVSINDLIGNVEEIKEEAPALAQLPSPVESTIYRIYPEIHPTARRRGRQFRRSQRAAERKARGIDGYLGIVRPMPPIYQFERSLAPEFESTSNDNPSF